MDALAEELDNAVLPRIRRYSLWSYYNQTSNDIIELFFLKHPAVIPTLRKIPNIDFFLKIEDLIVPFDLKFTHISDHYFDLASQGIRRDPDPAGADDFCVGENADASEIKRIKAYYSTYKRTHPEAGLPNLSGQEKNELCRRLLDTGDPAARAFVEEMKRGRAVIVPRDAEALHPLEWWNYKYQGERLFCNNNRLFVFLAYADQFIDGRELKRKTEAIGSKINELLDNLTPADIHTVRYRYEKSADCRGDYTARCVSTIYFE